MGDDIGSGLLSMIATTIDGILTVLTPRMEVVWEPCLYYIK